MFERSRRWPTVTSLGVSLAIIALVACFPTWTMRLRSSLATALGPGQYLADAGKRHLRAAWENFPIASSTAEQLAAASREADDLRNRNAQLAALLDQARREQRERDRRDDPMPIETAPLVSPELIQARVLGRQARSLVAVHDVIDMGASGGIQPHALVLQSAPVLDAGQDGHVQDGDLVLDGRRVVGRIAEVGRWTSTVLRVTAPGYRDLVRLSPADQPPSSSSPQGVLEGDGQTLCRIRHILTTEAVSVGDVVYTAADDGILPQPLVYGAVTRVVAAEDGTHWDIWMQPAAPHPPVQSVAVVRARLNTRRIARKTP